MHWRLNTPCPQAGHEVLREFNAGSLDLLTGDDLRLLVNTFLDEGKHCISARLHADVNPVQTSGGKSSHIIITDPCDRV